MIPGTFSIKARTHSMRGCMPRPPYMAGDWSGIDITFLQPPSVSSVSSLSIVHSQDVDFNQTRLAAPPHPCLALSETQYKSASGVALHLPVVAPDPAYGVPVK